MPVALPEVVSFEPENEFGGTFAQQGSRFRTFLCEVKFA